jgi:chromosome segregation ATPase
MSNEAGRAWRDIKTLAEMVRGLLELEDKLKEVGSLDKLKVEKEVEIQGLEAKAAKVEEVIAAAESTAAAIVKAANDRASSIDALEKQRSDRAEMVLADAKNKAQDIVYAAERAAEEARAKADGHVAAVKAELAKLTAQAEKVAGETVDAKALLDETVSKRVAIEAEIERLRNRFAR